MDKIREKIESIINKYNIELGYIIFNIQGSADIQLSDRINDRTESKIREEIQDTVHICINDIDYGNI